MAVTMTPFAGAGAPLLLSGKLFTNYIAQLMGTGLENVEMFRGECVRLQTIHRQDSDSAA
jgi:hypothetical protein